MYVKVAYSNISRQASLFLIYLQRMYRKQYIKYNEVPGLMHNQELKYRHIKESC